MAIKIAFFSFADIDNFGDILFSHIFKMEIKKRIDKVKIDFFTPSKCSIEGIQYESYTREKVESGNYDALIVFGGEVIHLYDDRTWWPIYKKNNKIIESSLPSDIIFDWTYLSNVYKAWISVGVRPIENDNDLIKIKETIDRLDYISVRGGLSKKILENLELQTNNSKIEITPDMGWMFSELLNYTENRGKLYKKYVNSSLYLVFQINNITKTEAEQIAHYLHDFQIKYNIQIVLLPVIRPWEDFKYLEMIKSFYPNEFLLMPNDLNILEIADILAHSKIVLTSSLHANITALSEGIPAGIINKWHGTKLQDLYGHQFRLNMLSHELSSIPKILDNLYKENLDGRKILEQYSNFMKLSLNKIFDQIVKDIIKNEK